MPVLVVGGGNTAVEEAIYLTNHASKVTLVHRRGELRAEKIMQDRLFNNEKIEVIWDSVLEEVVGNDDPPSVSGAKIKNVKTGETQEVPVEGVFIAIGHDPNTSLFKGKLDMDDEGYLITAPDSTATNIPGVFAAGDVQDKIYRQAVTAAGTGCMAALEAEHYLAALNSTVKAPVKDAVKAAE
jgi:thioredoxin reductase (NADPH)